MVGRMAVHGGTQTMLKQKLRPHKLHQRIENGGELKHRILSELQRHPPSQSNPVVLWERCRPLEQNPLRLWIVDFATITCNVHSRPAVGPARLAAVIVPGGDTTG